MKKLSIILILAVLIVLTGDEQALAWGPATHVGLGGSVLNQLALLPGAIGALLARNGLAYLYGNIAADIVFAKRMSRVKQFCHHWSTGFKMLETAEGEEGEAFAYGYLSHLAADTVAHGKFVPHQVTVTGQPVNIGHLYWELRADIEAGDEAKSVLERVIACDHDKHHRAMAKHIRGTLLPYPLNRRLFDSMNGVTMTKPFQGAIRKLRDRSDHPLEPALLSGYHSEAVDRIISVLAHAHRSPVLRDDPNGTSALMRASVHAKDRRKMRRRGLPVAQRTREVARGWEPAPAQPGSAA